MRHMTLVNMLLAFGMAGLYFFTEGPSFTYGPWLIAGFAFAGWRLEEQRGHFKSGFGKLFEKYYWGERQ